MDESLESAKEYFTGSAHHQRKSYERLINRIPFRDTHHIFDLGCGTAAMSARMATEIVPNGQVTACDPEKNRLSIAMEKFSDIPNLHFIHATGAAALESKVNLYDVIVTNEVLHWIKEDELDNTMRKMFTALKSGGIAAHTFTADISNVSHILGKIDERKLKALLEVIHPIQKQKFADMAREIGFDVVYSETFTATSEFNTVEDLLRFANASTYGLFGWEKVYSNAKSRGIQVEFDMSETGLPLYACKLHSFILKKVN